MRGLFIFPLLLVTVGCDRAGDAVNNAVEDAVTVPNGVYIPKAGDGLNNSNVTAVDPGPAAGPDRVEQMVPVALQGRWTGLREACSDEGADLELKVTPTQFLFHESVGTVTGVEPGPDGRFAVDAAFSGEGESWNRRLQVRTSDGGKRLTVANDGAAVVRKRCAAS